VITATVLTKNSAATLLATLESLRRFPEVLILDTGSTDKTLEIGRSFPNVRIVEREFQGFGKTHNVASELAAHDWILSIDSDEILSPELGSEILLLELDSQCVYSIDRHNYFEGKHIQCCAGWYPDRIIRLYNRKSTQFSEDRVHEKIISDGFRIVPLSHALIHTPYQTIEQFLHKMQVYSTLFADQNAGVKHSSLGKAIRHGLAAFLKSYFLKRGFLGGREGFIISLYNGHTAYYKYLKLAFQNNCSLREQLGSVKIESTKSALQSELD
jgi:glycosyltransferase involved in cell wall biosynthesis